MAECLVSGGICLVVVQAIFAWLWPALYSAGLLHNFGFMMPLPYSGFRPWEIDLLRTMADWGALLILGPALVLFPDRPWLAIFGLGLPWGLYAGLGLMTPNYPGSFGARVGNSAMFVAIALAEWLLCVGIVRALRGLGILRGSPVWH